MNKKQFKKELTKIKEYIHFNVFRTVKLMYSTTESSFAIHGFYNNSRIILKACFKDFDSTIQIHNSSASRTDKTELPDDYWKIYCLENNIKEQDLIDLFKAQFELIKILTLKSPNLLKHFETEPHLIIHFREHDSCTTCYIETLFSF